MIKSKICLSAIIAILLFACIGCSSGETSRSASAGSSQANDAQIVYVPSTAGKSQSKPAKTGLLELSFDFNRSETPSSDQYAVWIEDVEGKFIKTLYVTSFTENGGYNFRKDSLPVWVSKANPSNSSSYKMDAVSGATPRSGKQTYIWDCTDENGDHVLDGKYTFYVEGTLYHSSEVLFSGSFEVGGDTQNDIRVNTEYTEHEIQNKDMLTNFSAIFLTK